MDLNDLISQFQVTTESESGELNSLISDYASLQHLYSAGIKTIRAKLEILDEEFRVRYDYNPIHHMEHRLKTPGSTIAKLKKKNLPLETGAIRRSLTDVAGIRVICNYRNDIYRIADYLLSQSDLSLIRKRDYIQSPKDNGYRSLHLVVAVPVFLSDCIETVPVEIQIRTIAMDFWASLEHHTKYKSDCQIPKDLHNGLVECAETIEHLESKMQSIFLKVYDAEKKKSRKFKM